MDKISREQVEKVWRGEWEEERFAGELEGWQHTECGRHSTEKSNWCPKCGKAMTNEAVDIEMDRLEALQDEIEVQDTIPATQWISVEERLPERNGTYIVTACDEGEPYDMIIWNDTVVVCAEYYKGCWTWEENNIEYSLDGIVTHWMPLPEPPKGEKS